MRKTIVIIGGVAGGASAAARLRRLDEEAEIILFERGGYISFANCGLPYYIGETIEDRAKLLVQTPETMKARFNLDIRIHSEVTGIDSKAKKVFVRSKNNGTYEQPFDALILAPGAKALRPPIPGISNDKILTLRNIPDTDRIKAVVDQSATQSAVVIGGGYVGVEMAENLRERGLQVTLIEAAPHILAPFDSEFSAIIENKLEDHGIGILLGDAVKAFNDVGNQLEITLQSGKKLNTDLAILAIGVAPDTAFIKDSGIEIGQRGHIRVDDHMQTNIKDIYAVGDAIEVIDRINGQTTAIPLAGPANKQGRIAADNIAGIDSVYKGTQGTAILKIFDLTAASTGNNERTLKRLNLPYRTVYVHPGSHASYYPGAAPITLKLLFNDEGKILGAQAVGHEGVDKRIDVIATVIRLNGSVADLAELELSYAPPFSSAKDPVNMAGFTAENILSGKMQVIVPEQLADRDPESTLLIDVRNESEFNCGGIPGAVNIPVDLLRERLSGLDPQKEIWVYCQVGLRGYIASRILMQQGFRVKNLTGGYKLYAASRFIPSGISGPASRPAAKPTFQE